MSADCADSSSLRELARLCLPRRVRPRAPPTTGVGGRQDRTNCWGCAGGRSSVRVDALSVGGGVPEERHYLETDGSVRPGERHKARDWIAIGGAGVILFDPGLRAICSDPVNPGRASCGLEAERRGGLIGLRRANERRVERVGVRTDCLGVVRRSTGQAELGTPWATPYLAELRELVGSFEFVEARWTPSSRAVERRAGVPTADPLAGGAAGLGPRRDQQSCVRRSRCRPWRYAHSLIRRDARSANGTDIMPTPQGRSVGKGRVFRAF